MMTPVGSSYRKPIHDEIKSCYRSYGVIQNYVGPNNSAVPWTPFVVAFKVQNYLWRGLDLMNRGVVEAPASPTFVKNLIEKAEEARHDYSTATAALLKKLPTAPPELTFYRDKVLNPKATYDFWYSADAAMLQFDAADGIDSGGFKLFWQAVKDEATGLIKGFPSLSLPSLDTGPLRTFAIVGLVLWGASILMKGK